MLCSPRVQRASEKRRGNIGLTDADVDLCRAALLDVLADGAALSRTQCYGVFKDAGVDPDGGRGTHMPHHFGGEGDIIQSVPDGTVVEVGPTKNGLAHPCLGQAGRVTAPR